MLFTKESQKRLIEKFTHKYTYLLGKEPTKEEIGAFISGMDMTFEYIDRRVREEFEERRDLENLSKIQFRKDMLKEFMKKGAKNRTNVYELDSLINYLSENEPATRRKILRDLQDISTLPEDWTIKLLKNLIKG